YLVDLKGYHWRIEYSLAQLARHKRPSSRFVWVRFVDRDDNQFTTFGRNALPCFWKQREAGKAPLAAASACLTDQSRDQVIRLTLEDPPPEDGPPICHIRPDKCPPH